MKVCAILSMLAVFMLVHTNPAFAYVVTVYAEGVVTEVQTYDGLEFDGSVTVGSTMTGLVTYDTETPDQKPQYGWVACYSLISISMNVGNYTFIGTSAAAGEPSFSITAEPQWFNYDVLSPRALFYGPCYLNGEPTNLEDVVPEVGFRIMSLQGDNDGTITDALPDVETFPDLSVCTEQRVFRAESWLTPAFVIHGEVTSVTVVPEPASAVIMGLGAVVLILRRRLR